METKAINYSKEYSKALADAYPYALQFGALWKNDNTKKYVINNADSIYIPHIEISGGLEDGDRDTIGSFTRKQSNRWELKQLKNHKTWNTLVHPMDVIQSNDILTIQNATKAYNERIKFPYLDNLLLETVYTDSTTQLSNANVKEATLTSQNVLTYFDSLMDTMDDAFVPMTGRKLYVPTAVKTLIDNSKDILRTSGNKVIGRTVSRIDEVEVIGVPTKAMTLKDGTVIQMFLVHPSLILPFINYEFVGIEAPSVHSQGKALYFEEFFADVFILEDLAAAAQYVIPEK